MARLKTINPESATGKTKDLFTSIEGKLGMVPNMMRTMANSPAFLEGYLNLSGSLSGGNLSAKTGGLIALTVAETNGCNYCLSAHSFIGTNLLKLDAEAMDAARQADATDHKTDAILKFAKALVAKKGKVNDGDVATVKEAGVTDGEMAEIVGHVALNILTNYFNIAAKTEIDFPVVEAGADAVA